MADTKQYVVIDDQEILIEVEYPDKVFKVGKDYEFVYNYGKPGEYREFMSRDSVVIIEK